MENLVMEDQVWIDDNPLEKPFGEYTFGIVDDAMGGIIAYVNDDNLATLFSATLSGQYEFIAPFLPIRWVHIPDCDVRVPDVDMYYLGCAVHPMLCRLWGGTKRSLISRVCDCPIVIREEIEDLIGELGDAIDEARVIQVGKAEIAALDTAIRNVDYIRRNLELYKILD